MCCEPVVLTSELRYRSVVSLRDGEAVFERLKVPLVRCPATHRSRVLPADIAPRKVFTPSVQVATVSAHVEENRPLRKAARAVGGVAPHHSTLHGWCGGMGDMAGGRGQAGPGVAIGVARVEVERRTEVDVAGEWARPVEISPERYRSEQRREQLENAARVILLARQVASELDGTCPSETTADALERSIEAARAMSALDNFLVGTCAVTRISWWARSRYTPFQHHRDRASGIPCPSTLKPRRLESACGIPTRSPPSGSR
jgi:hypothetical protein